VTPQPRPHTSLATEQPAETEQLEHPPAADALSNEPDHGPQQKAHRGCLLLIRQQLDVSQSRGVVDGHMSFLVAGTMGAAKPAITGDPVTDPFKASQLFGVDVDHVAGLCPLVAAHRLCRLQVLEPAKPYGLEHPANGGERSCQHPGNTTEGAALMTEVHSALQLQWIERPPLTASIHQRSSTA